MESAAVPASAPVKRPRGRPPKPAAERDDGNRRHALVVGAARLFRRKGYAATSTRDIAAAAGMRSGSPFYHFKSKQALLSAVMEEGMRTAIVRQQQALQQGGPAPDAAQQLRRLVRSHFAVLLGPGSDFVPVMLYEWRSLTARQRATLDALQRQYEAPWLPVLEALQAEGRLRSDVKLARLLIFGALNWAVQWYDRRGTASLEDLTDAALGLFIGEAPA